jgi:DNA-binding winged helix-turn-helix (wHTH) protein
MSEPLPRFYEFGPFSVDTGKRLLLRNGEPVPLAPKVLETLLVLVENRDRVLSKDELLRQVWGDTIVEEGGLTRNVSVLRKVLGEKPEDHQYIVTVPARGYRFVGSASRAGHSRIVGRPAIVDSGARATVVGALDASLARSRGYCARGGDARVCAATGPSH